MVALWASGVPVGPSLCRPPPALPMAWACQAVFSTNDKASHPTERQRDVYGGRNVELCSPLPRDSFCFNPLVRAQGT